MFRRLDDIKREHFPKYHKRSKKKTKQRRIRIRENDTEKGSDKDIEKRTHFIEDVIKKIKMMIKRYR